ncbi:MAG: phosphate acetyltransferase [Planctomycetes bacterium]|nr:phosphate acetyltransferase [Planctomycetota bacterium]
MLDHLRERAHRRQARIVLPEVLDPRTIAARDQLQRDRLCEVVWVEDPRQDPRLADVAAHIYHRRKHRGLDEVQALELAAQPVAFGAGLVALGHADAGVSGATHATAEVIRAGLFCVGTAPGIPLVSSMFLLTRGDEVLSFADCGVVPDPDPDQLVHIAAATAHNHRCFTGQPPRVAFLSFSTRGSADHAKVRKMRSAAERFRAAHPTIASDGELQFDAAYVPAVAARKCPDSALHGRANVFVFPDLDAGNLAYKITERLGGFRAFGPLLQGFGRPWLDLSRGCTADDIVGVAVLASAMLDGAVGAA